MKHVSTVDLSVLVVPSPTPDERIASSLLLNFIFDLANLKLCSQAGLGLSLLTRLGLDFERSVSLCLLHYYSWPRKAVS